jgi:hypothetical protein
MANFSLIRIKNPARILSVALGILISACSPPTDQVQDANRAALVGSWESTGEDNAVQYKETITLKSDGTFDSSSTRTKDSIQTRFAETGEWHLHGKQFKRHYKLRDGQPITQKEQAYVTLEIVGIVTKQSFEGKDNINKVSLQFKRQ